MLFAGREDQFVELELGNGLRMLVEICEFDEREFIGAGWYSVTTHVGARPGDIVVFRGLGAGSVSAAFYDSGGRRLAPAAQSVPRELATPSGGMYITKKGQLHRCLTVYLLVSCTGCLGGAGDKEMDGRQGQVCVVGPGVVLTWMQAAAVRRIMEDNAGWSFYIRNMNHTSICKGMVVRSAKALYASRCFMCTR